MAGASARPAGGAVSVPLLRETNVTPDTGEIDRLLLRALERPPEARARYLDQTCADRPTLRAEIDRLLAAADTEDPRLRSAGAGRPELLDTAAERLIGPGAIIDRYRLLEEIGRGGMGVVYLAERADGAYEQRVALKVIGLLAGGSSLARFRRERQILATLEHRRIARLLDGGVTEAGTPFLVMEHVDGQPIDRHCDHHATSLERRLTLLIDVCDAVASAHRALIVHRDLKPSNILVTREGSVKLVDFGIAKLLSPGTEAAQLTATRVMTPQYASPEQLRGETVGTTSDVYQLGLVAYELLSGIRPYDVGDTTPSSVERLICEQPPTPPSTAVANLSDQTLPAVPSRALRGDLDTIVLKALRKDPGQRYASVEALRDDLQRHLSGWPIRARPATMRYRLGKLLHRHAAATVAIALGVVLLVAVATTFTVRLAQERDQRLHEAMRADQARVLAEQRQAESEEIQGILLDLFEATEPGASDTPLSPRSLLDRGAARMANRLVDRPRSRARLLNALGRLYRKQGIYDEAETLTREGLALRSALEPPDEADLAESLHDLSAVLIARSVFDEAGDAVSRALALRRKTLGPSHPLVGTSLALLAHLAYHEGRTADAESNFRQALEILGTAYGASDPRVVEVAIDHASTLGGLGRYDEAQEALEGSVTALERTIGSDHPGMIDVLHKLGLLHSERRQPARARKYYERSLRIVEASLEDGHPSRIALHANLGASLQELGEPVSAHNHFERALQLSEQTHGPDHFNATWPLNNLGVLALEDLDDPIAAEAYFRRMLRIVAQSVDADHPQLALGQNNLGEALAAQGRHEAAMHLFESAHDLFTRVLGPKHLYVSWPLLNLAKLYAGRGDHEQAEPLFEEAVGLRQSALEAGHPERVKAEEAWQAFREETTR